MTDYSNFMVAKKSIVFLLDDGIFSKDMLSAALDSVSRHHVLRRRNGSFEVSFLLRDVGDPDDFGLAFNDALIAAVRLKS
jgi:dTDP-glucose pyrophosphorylase